MKYKSHPVWFIWKWMSMMILSPKLVLLQRFYASTFLWSSKIGLSITHPIVAIRFPQMSPLSIWNVGRSIKSKLQIWSKWTTWSINFGYTQRTFSSSGWLRVSSNKPFGPPVPVDLGRQHHSKVNSDLNWRRFLSMLLMISFPKCKSSAARRYDAPLAYS